MQRLQSCKAYFLNLRHLRFRLFQKIGEIQIQIISDKFQQRVSNKEVEEEDLAETPPLLMLAGWLTSKVQGSREKLTSCSSVPVRVPLLRKKRALLTIICRGMRYVPAEVLSLIVRRVLVEAWLEIEFRILST